MGATDLREEMQNCGYRTTEYSALKDAVVALMSLASYPKSDLCIACRSQLIESSGVTTYPQFLTFEVQILLSVQLTSRNELDG
jgi:hypothetical protein